MVNLFVRIPERLGALVASFKSPKTQVITNLLEAFSTLEPLDQAALVEGSDTLTRVGSLIASESWSNHCFARGHWPVAAKCYVRLTRAVADSPEHCGFVFYRLGYALNEFALSFRRAALELADSGEANSSLCKNYFDECKNWLEKSIMYSQFAVSEIGCPALYNQVCCYSALGQLAIERALQGKGSWLKALANEVRGDAATNQTWRNEIGPEWRRILDASKVEREVQFRTTISHEDVDEFGHKAMACLEQLASVQSKNLPGPTADFFRRFAGDDPDLIFVNSDSEFRPALEKWCEGSAEDHKWLLQASEELSLELSELPQAPSGAMNPLASGLGFR